MKHAARPSTSQPSDRIPEPIDADGIAVDVLAFTGTTTSDVDARSADEVIRDAELAMHRAEASHPGSLRVFDASLCRDGPPDRPGKPTWTAVALHERHRTDLDDQ